MEKNGKGGSTVVSSAATLGVWEPLVGFIHTKALSSSKRDRKRFSIGIVVAIVVFSALFTVVHIPRIVHAIVGIPLGVALFAVVLGGAYIYYEQHPEKETLRKKYPPLMRIKIGVALFAVLAIVMLVASSLIPYILGGILAVAASLLIYEFMRRDQEEIIMNESGQLDPRDEEIFKKREEERSEKEREKVAGIFNDLTDEQKILIMQGKVEEAFDIKEIKKTKRFGRKK